MREVVVAVKRHIQCSHDFGFHEPRLRVLNPVDSGMFREPVAEQRFTGAEVELSRRSLWDEPQRLQEEGSERQPEGGAASISSKVLPESSP